MPQLTRTKSGLWTSRKVIPADVRSTYGKSEEKPTWPASLTRSEAVAEFSSWLTSVESRIDLLRKQASEAPVRLAAAPASMFSLAGVERIEVLKGPQGTLFGRNATGGLIQVVTKKPSETFGGSMSASYGNYRTAGVDAYLTGGLFPGVAFDVAAHAWTQGEGYGRNRFLNIDANRKKRDLAFRSQLMWTGEATSARLSVDYSEMSGSPNEYRRSPFDISTLGPIIQNQSPWDSNGNVAYKLETKSYGVHLNVDHELPFADLVSITAWRGATMFNDLDADTTPTPGLNVRLDEEDTQFSQELQLVSKPDSTVSWLVGLYYFDANAKYDPVSTF